MFEHRRRWKDWRPQRSADKTDKIEAHEENIVSFVSASPCPKNQARASRQDPLPLRDWEQRFVDQVCEVFPNSKLRHVRQADDASILIQIDCGLLNDTIILAPDSLSDDDVGRYFPDSSAAIYRERELLSLIATKPGIDALQAIHQQRRSCSTLYYNAAEGRA